MGFDDDREMSRVEKALLPFQVRRTLNDVRRDIRCIVFVTLSYNCGTRILGSLINFERI